MKTLTIYPQIDKSTATDLFYTFIQRKPTPTGIQRVTRERSETSGQIGRLLEDYQSDQLPSSVESVNRPPLTKLGHEDGLLAYKADLKDAPSLFDLYKQLTFKGNPNEKSNPSKEDWINWWRGWLVYVPQVLEEVEQGLFDNRFYYTVRDAQENVIAFMLAKCLGSGLTEDQMRERHLAMTTFQPDALSEEYLKDPKNFHQIAWMEIAGVRSGYARKGIITDLEMLALQDFYNGGVIEHAIGEILVAPYTNIGSIQFHEEKFAAVPICRRDQPETLFGNKTSVATWKVYEWKVFHRLVEARKKGFLPAKIEDFSDFRIACLRALNRQDLSVAF